MSSHEDSRWTSSEEDGAVDIRVDDWHKLGAVLREARTAQGLSQHALAARAGVSRSWLARVEGGHRGAEIEQLFRLLEVLGLDLVLRDRRPPRASVPAFEQPSSVAVPEDVIARHRAVAADRRRAWREATGAGQRDD